MKRSRFLLRVKPSHPDREKFLGSTRAIAASLGLSVKHPRWTSYGALEVDVFTPSAQDFELFVAALEPLSKIEFTRNLDEPALYKAKEEIPEAAAAYFNSERYWECHEALEPAWRTAEGEEKRLVQGLILVCAALVHEQRGEREVALDIYGRALPQIAWRERLYHGIDIARLRKTLEDSLARREVSPFRI